MPLERCYNIEDLRQGARRRLPKGLFEFIDRATEDDIAVRRNRTAFETISLAPKMLADVSQRSTRVELFGRSYEMPLAVAPAGPAGFFWYKGELALAKAAAKAGIPFTLSTYSTTEMSEIIETCPSAWFQLYLWNDRSLSHALAERAQALGFNVLVVTIDTPLLGQREYLRKNGFAPPFKASPRALADMLLHPRWLASVPLRYVLGPGWPRVVNQPEGVERDKAVAQRATMSQSLTWDEIKRLRDKWSGPLVVKGLLRPDDAEKAVAAGVDGISVSNHGGRNLDSAVSPIEVLPEIAATVGTKCTLLLDSGVRRGSDIVKAIALGAKAVLVGRPMLYGVAVAGERGAAHAMEIFRSELSLTMALIGSNTVEDITMDLIHRPGSGR